MSDNYEIVIVGFSISKLLISNKHKMFRHRNHFGKKI